MARSPRDVVLSILAIFGLCIAVGMPLPGSAGDSFATPPCEPDANGMLPR